jgi:hypothetical protein
MSSFDAILPWSSRSCFSGTEAGACQWRDVVNGPRHVGQLITHTIQHGDERYNVATLRPVDPMADPLVPDLYEPVLVGVSLLAFRLRGYERIDMPEGHSAPSRNGIARRRRTLAALISR